MDYQNCGTSGHLIKSYVNRKGQFIFAEIQENRLGRLKRLLNKLKPPHEHGMLWLFSGEKNFNQDQKMNRRKDRWLYADSSEVPRVMHTKYPATVMVLGAGSSEGHVMPPYNSPQGLRVNADGYIDVLKWLLDPGEIK